MIDVCLNALNNWALYETSRQFKILLNLLCTHTEIEKERAFIISLKELLIIRPATQITIPKQTHHKLLESLDIFEQKFITVDSLDTLKSGVIYTIEKCEHFSKKVFSNKGNDKDLHRLRIWIKNLYYQLIYIDKVFPTNKKLKNDLHKLGNDLGVAHDLIIIKHRIESLKENTLKREAYSLMDKHISRIINNAKPVYKKLFNSPALKKIR